MSVVGLPNPKTIPNFVAASTPQGVRRLFAKKQSDLGAFLRPLGAPSFVDGKWYIWFLEDQKPEEMIKDFSKGE